MNTTSTKSYKRVAEIKANLSPKTMAQYKVALIRSYRECGLITNGSSALDDLSWIETHHIKILDEISSKSADLGLGTRRSRVSLFKEVFKQMNFVNAYLYFGHHHTQLFDELASETVQHVKASTYARVTGGSGGSGKHSDNGTRFGYAKCNGHSYLF